MAMLILSHVKLRSEPYLVRLVSLFMYLVLTVTIFNNCMALQHIIFIGTPVLNKAVRSI